MLDLPRKREHFKGFVPDTTPTEPAFIDHDLMARPSQIECLGGQWTDVFRRPDPGQCEMRSVWAILWLEPSCLGSLFSNLVEVTEFLCPFDDSGPHDGRLSFIGKAAKTAEPDRKRGHVFNRCQTCKKPLVGDLTHRSQESQREMPVLHGNQLAGNRETGRSVGQRHPHFGRQRHPGEDPS